MLIVIYFFEMTSKKKVITIMKKAYNYGDLDVVRNIIDKMFIITQNDNDYLTSCLIKEIINENSKEYISSQRISQALLSYKGV